MLQLRRLDDVPLLELMFILILMEAESLQHHNDRLVYVDRACLKSLKTSDLTYRIEARVCDYVILQTPIANPFALQPAKFGVDVYRPYGSTVWTVSLVWNDTKPCDRKLYFKVGFAARRYYVIKRDKICVDLRFEKRNGEEVNYHHEFKFDCLRVKPDNVGTMTIVDHPLTRGCASSLEKHDIQTECQCPEQGASAFMDSHGLLTVEFVRQPRVSGYRIKVNDKLNGQLIGDSEQTQMNTTMDVVKYQTFGSDGGKGFIANVTFWCSSLTTDLVMKRVCKVVVLNETNPILQPPLQSKETKKDSPTSWNIVIIVVLLLAGTISAIVVFAVHNRRVGSLGSTVKQNQGSSSHTSYRAVGKNEEPSPSVNNTSSISNALHNQSPESPSTSADDCEQQKQSPNIDCPYIQIRRCVILFHPDKLTAKIADMESMIEHKGYNVCTHPCLNLKKSQGAVENWLTSSDEIVQHYDDVIFVISPKFNLLWFTYGSTDEERKMQQEQLLSERKGRENIPCSVLSTMSKAQFHNLPVKPRIHIVSLECVDTQRQVPPFLITASFLESIATVYCLNPESDCTCGDYKIQNTLPVFNELALSNNFSHVS